MRHPCGAHWSLQWTPRGAGADFGHAAQSGVDSMQAAFFAHALADAEPPDRTAEARVHLSDLTHRAWRLFDTRPEPTPRVLHLAGNGLAPVREAWGRLQDAPPAAPHHQRFVHDPWRPAPSVGLHHGGGFADRASVVARFDIACFTTAPFDAPLPLAGTSCAENPVEADAASFDLHATLSLVVPDGRAPTLSDGMARAASPGVLAIALRQLCLTVEPGQRLRLSLAGASFPAHAVNPGTGRTPLRSTAAEALPIAYAAVVAAAGRVGRAPSAGRRAVVGLCGARPSRRRRFAYPGARWDGARDEGDRGGRRPGWAGGGAGPRRRRRGGDAGREA